MSYIIDNHQWDKISTLDRLIFIYYVCVLLSIHELKYITFYFHTAVAGCSNDRVVAVLSLGCLVDYDMSCLSLLRGIL